MTAIMAIFLSIAIFIQRAGQGLFGLSLAFAAGAFTMWMHMTPGV